MEFNLPTTVEGGLDDEETMPLDGKASTPDHEGDKAGGDRGQ